MVVGRVAEDGDAIYDLNEVLEISIALLKADQEQTREKEPTARDS